MTVHDGSIDQQANKVPTFSIGEEYYEMLPTEKAMYDLYVVVLLLNFNISWYQGFANKCDIWG